jgi:hypothetical protein
VAFQTRPIEAIAAMTVNSLLKEIAPLALVSLRS